NRINANNELRLMAYYGQRKTEQFQAIPVATQRPPGHSGGVIDLERNYGGVDARWTSDLQLAGRPLTLIGGIAYDTLREERRGYENFTGSGRTQQLGVKGQLRRNETNDLWNIDPYLQASWEFTEKWTLDLGMRYSTVNFRSDDHYIQAGNQDDSGSLRYRKALPMGALRYQATPDLNLYVTVGRGFETPTFNELSYRSDGLAGLNLALQPSVNTSVEIGAKARLGNSLLTAALFQTRTQDEIVAADSLGGRSTFRNAGRTLRKGFELSWQGELARHWQGVLAYTWHDRSEERRGGVDCVGWRL